MATTVKLTAAGLVLGMTMFGSSTDHELTSATFPARYAGLPFSRQAGPMSPNPAFVGGQCDENCSACLLRGPWGCITEGNDPVCEARKAACQANNAIPGGNILNAPVQAGPTVLNQCLQNLGACPPAIINQVPSAQLTMTCLNDVAHCPYNIIKSIPVAAVHPLVQQYLSSLRNQASGRYKTLEPEFIARFQVDYPDASLVDVRYATDINTTHGQAITIGDVIYFPGSVDLWKRSGMQLMLHELEHTAQYRRKGGVEPFLSEYILHAVGNIAKYHSLNIHDDIAVEKDAIAKAASEIKHYGWNVMLDNRCQRPIAAYLYVYRGGGWKLAQYDQGASHRSILNWDHGTLHTVEPVYWYAQTKDDGPLLRWAGDTMLPINGKQYGFRQIPVQEQHEYVSVVPTC